MINLLGKLELDKKKVGLIILICVIIIYVDFAFLIKLQLRNTTAVGAKIIKLKNDIEVLNKDLVTMQQSSKKQEVAIKLKKIISEEQIPSLFQSISNIANRNNVKIMEIKPSKGAKSSVSGGFTPMLVTLDLSCGYHGLGKFINDLENAEVFIEVENLKILPQSQDYFKHGVNLVLKTYVGK